MAPLQIPKNFKFEPLYPFPLPLQDEVGLSSSSPPTFDDNPPIILTKSSPEDLFQQSCKKKKILYEISTKF
jgi:hypothetical protein